MTQLHFNMLSVILDAYRTHPRELEKVLRDQAEVHLNGADVLEFCGNHDEAAHARLLASQCMTCGNLTRVPFDEDTIAICLDEEIGLLIIAFSAASLCYRSPRT